VSAPVDRDAAEDWIRTHVQPAGTIEAVHVRPWAAVLRVPLGAGVSYWFKACPPAQAFEARLTAGLFARWPDRVVEVVACDEQRAWLLLADAGKSILKLGSPPEAWLAMLPRYAELQIGEAENAGDHLAHGVPDLRVAILPTRYHELLRRDLPLEAEEVHRLRGFADRFAELCAELAGDGVPGTVQHDDLHDVNIYAKSKRLRVLDWGDTSISHPFASLVVTFRFVALRHGLQPDDPWFARLRDAYLEPWGSRLTGTFALAMRVGAFAHTFGWARHRDQLDDEARARFDNPFGVVLRRALVQIERS
jgi:hypothetical protein